MAVNPTQALAESLRELANAAYGNPDAKWESPQQLVRDALKAAKVLQITPDMISRAIAWHNSQNLVMAISPTTNAENQEQTMDRWLIGLLTAAFADDDDTVMSPRPVPAITFGKVTQSMIIGQGVSDGTSYCLLCGANIPVNVEGHMHDTVELHRAWHEDLNHLRTYVGDV
jgi:hypothetical protein